MKKKIILFSLFLLLVLVSYGKSIEKNKAFESSHNSQISEIAEKVYTNKSLSEQMEMKVRLTFDGGEAIMKLENNAVSKEFFSQLPMTRTFEDFNNIEKICRLSDKLSTNSVEKGVDPNIADVTLYAPWNTLVFYYKDYGYNDDLIAMGRVESGMEQLASMGDSFTVTMEQIKNENQKTEITMTVGEDTITAELLNNEITKLFLETLPRTFIMKRYGDREYYSRMESISENGETIIDFENGDVTYYPAGPSFAVFFAGEENSNQSGLIRLGKIKSDLSIFDTMGDTIEMRVEIKKP